MALIELDQHYGEEPEEAWEMPTFKEKAGLDIAAAFFNAAEHAEEYRVDGTPMLGVMETGGVKEHNSHWEGGAKQNFDDGLYAAHSILYLKVEDYGAKPKVGRELVLEGAAGWRRRFNIQRCEEEDGVYRMTLKRVRQ